MLLAVQADGADVATVEGLAAGRRADAAPAGVPRASRAPVRLLHAGDADGATRLLAQNPQPTDDEIRKGLQGNICRCTGYWNIIKAVKAASGQEVAE